jgi:ligand-binding sensor domain-containing protein
MGLVSNLRVYQIVDDKNKNIWFGTDRGFSIYNPQSKQFKNFTPNQNISYKVISSINSDNKGDF